MERYANEVFRDNESNRSSRCAGLIKANPFLFEYDIAEQETINLTAYEPSSDPEFCNQNSRLYVSGYALRMKDDSYGFCCFLINGNCRIYIKRFYGCRIYPHMLCRSAGKMGHVTWWQFARRNEHGRYDPSLSFDECLVIAREVKVYENAFLIQQISFLETIHESFTLNNLCHDPEKYQKSTRQYLQGRPVDISVYPAVELKKCRMGKPDISP